jgi:hypothetical protein
MLATVCTDGQTVVGRAACLFLLLYYDFYCIVFLFFDLFVSDTVSPLVQMYGRDSHWYSPPSFNRSPMSPPLATGLTWGLDKRVQVQPFAEPSCLI